MTTITVKEAYDRIYHQTGFVASSERANDPNSKTMIEQESRRRALSELDPKDRAVVVDCVKRMKQCCPGVMLGDSAALQILEHLGVFLMQAERV